MFFPQGLKQVIKDRYQLLQQQRQVLLKTRRNENEKVVVFWIKLYFSLLIF
jgi:hypothetical protein